MENLLYIYKQLLKCTNEDEVQTLKKRLTRSNILCTEAGKKSEGPLHQTGGSENVGKSRLLSEKSREVDNLIKEVKEHAERRRLVVDLTIKVIEDIQVEFPTSDLIGKGFASHMHEISSFLTMNHASGIGVWGMGGVGKTTLIKHLHNMMLTQPSIFGSVYWITVSNDCNVRKLQSDIAERMGVPISDKVDESQRAGILFEGVKEKEKFVLILDDMWSDYDLNELGLGIRQQTGYRMIVTSRSKLVCSKMHCDKIIKLDPLSNQDALTLFDRNIGHEIPDDLRKIRFDLVEECAGLPLGIITLAKSMRGCDDVREWRDVLENLRNSSNRVDGMGEKVFAVLRVSFERVTDPEIKECLLYCATYPEDSRIEINELIWLFICAGLLGENIGMAKMFDKGLAILKKLERVALLSIERESLSLFDESDCVCLHDLIRDMALQIAGSRFMAKAGKGLMGVPDQRCWTEDLQVVSLMDNMIQEVFDFSPSCNKLTTLLLKTNFSLSKVSHGFFLRLNELKFIELSGSRITTLPKSISSLKNLTALILRGCHHLIELPSLENLTSLEILDLYQTSIKQIPKGVKSLTKLRHLNIFNTNIERTGAGVISKLTALQYLALEARIDVQELISLTKLEHLSVVFNDLDSFSTFMEQMNIRGRPSTYTFVLGNFNGKHLIRERVVESEKLIYVKTLGGSSADGNRYGRLAKILFGDERKSSWSWPFTTSPDTEGRARPFCENELQKLIQDIHLLDISGDKNMMSLGDFVFEKICDLRRGSEMEERGAKPFSNLKSLKLYDCSNLKKLFPLGLLSNLQNMEILYVLDCNNLEELIGGASDGMRSGGFGNSKIVSLPKLRSITLEHLPNLKTLCQSDKVIHTPSIITIHIRRCSKLKRMTFDLDNHRFPLPQIYLEGERNWMDSLKWDPPESKSKLQVR